MNSEKTKQVNDKTFFKTLEDKYVYLIAFLAGLIEIVLVPYLFLGPFLVYTSSNITSYKDILENLQDNLIKYQGFMMSVAYIVTIALALVFLRKMFIDDFKDFKCHWKKYLLLVLIGIASILAFAVLFDFLNEKLNIEGSSINQEAIEASLMGNGKWAMIISSAILAPIVEDLVFRKFLYGFLSKTKLHIIFTTIIVALLFAFIHCTAEDFTKWVAYYFLLNYLALSLSITIPFVLAKGNVYVSIIVHMFNNIYTLLVLYGVINAII